MSEGKSLAIFGLLIGIIGAGLAGYMFYTDYTTPPEEERVYSEYVWSTLIDNVSFSEIEDLTIKIDVEKDDIVYVLFTGTATNYATYTYIRLYLDNEQTDEGFTELGNEDSMEKESVSIQCVFDDLDEGDYEFSIYAKGDSSGVNRDRLSYSTLFIKIYKD